VPRLTVVLTGLQEETTCHFDYSPVTIGRDPACECPIDDRTVSNHHAQFSFHHNQWWLTDLGSTNGTILNSQLVTEAVVLMSGDQIQCGQVGLVISMDQESGERAFGVQSSRGSA
jgi:pSer/pThr/pTyr-binding forkhead associated (FHA) protein